MHRLSAGAGYTYLLRHTACGDTHRDPATSLTAYYTETGYPPGRWVGSGLTGLDAGQGLAAGSVVTEPQMAALFGRGADPVNGKALGKCYPTYPTAAERSARRIAALPADLSPTERANHSAAINEAERGRSRPVAVAGFDLTFTVPKSASVLWALSDPRTQAVIAAAHQRAVTDALAFLEERALFTRTGTAGCAQVATGGMLATAFDHWDTRTGDPNLHTHIVVANKVQGPDGTWRTLDSRALHHATVAVSELYDDLLADHLVAALPVRWNWRSRGSRRTPAFELDGIGDDLLAEFSTRSVSIGAALTERLTNFHTTHGRGPSRVEVLQLRQQVTRSTRPAKTPRPLTELLTRWRDQAERLTGHPSRTLTDAALTGGARALRVDQISPDLRDRLTEVTLAGVMERRSTWTRWNVLTEVARSTRGLRLASTGDRLALIDQLTDAVLTASIALDPPEVVAVPAFRRADGSSVFTRPGEYRFSHPRLLDAEQRLLAANQLPSEAGTEPQVSGALDPDGLVPLVVPGIPEHVARRLANTPQHLDGMGASAQLAQDQLAAVVEIGTSGRQLDVLVGPAGTGKTTTLRALRAAWETVHGRGSVLGLAPSATAAHELSAALSVPCENTAKWLHETSGPAGQQRTAILATLDARQNAGDPARARPNADTRLRLVREQQRWVLRPGQLLIVDEASLAGTLALDELRAQTARAGAKLLLVGDHRQLTAVDAGGAFGLLAERGHSAELRSLWRFTERWEANATRGLRCGDPGVLQTYADHDRLLDGPSEVMLEAAYAGWQASEQAGQAALLVAHDSHSVQALNTRAHTDRVRAGLVTDEVLPLGPAGERGEVGVGDRIVTRRNDRQLVLPAGGHVRNGALWTVTAVHSGGALTVAPADQPLAPGVEMEPSCLVTLPASYVTEHVDLGYATTVHRAQGLTVGACHVLVGPGMSREALYVAMTRGRRSNRAYVATDAVDPDCEPLPDMAAVRTGVEVLTQVLASSRAELSATQTREQRHDDAGSLRALIPIRQTVLAHQEADRWQPLLTRCGLTGDQTDSIQKSRAFGALLAALHQGANAGHDMPAVLGTLIRDRPLEGAQDAARDVAATLHYRVDQWLQNAPTALPTGPADAAGALRLTDPLAPRDDQQQPAHRQALDALDDLIADRIDAVTSAALRNRPAWLPPTPFPAEGYSACPEWVGQVAAVAAYRDLTDATGTAALGPDRSTDDTDRARRLAAAAALSQLHAAPPSNQDWTPMR